jgi:hypothetical protein
MRALAVTRQLDFWDSKKFDHNASRTNLHCGQTAGHRRTANTARQAIVLRHMLQPSNVHTAKPSHSARSTCFAEIRIYGAVRY